MIEIDEVRQMVYGIAVQYNGGEGELIILASAGQSGHSSLYIVDMGVDGGSSVQDDILRSVPYGSLKDKDVWDTIEEVLREKWARSYSVGRDIGPIDNADELMSQISNAWKDYSSFDTFYIEEEI